MKHQSKNAPKWGLALALVTMLSLSPLAGYSLNRSTRLPFATARAEPQAVGIDVTPVLDTARAVIESITREGGTIKASAADGTRFTLELPPDALFEDEVITVTPVLSVTDLPFSGGMTAVQLEPEGLVLRRPAALTIEPPAPVPVDEEAPFAWDEAGSDFHLYPLQADPAKVLMPLIHFSGYGLGRGTAAERAAQQQRGTKRYRSGLDQKREKLTGDERRSRSQSGGTTKKKAKKFSKKLRNSASADAQDVSGQVESALQSKVERQIRCTLKQALETYESESLISPLTGGPVALSPEEEVLRQKIRQALETLRDSAYARCRDEPGPDGALTLLGLAREAARLGADFPEFLLLAADMYQKAEQCAQFELEFESIITEFFPDHIAEFQVKAKVPLRLDLNRVSGEAPLEYVKFVWRVPPPCSASAEAYNTRDSKFKVLDVVLDLNRSEDPCSPPSQGSSQKTPIVEMKIDPGQTWERVSATTCPRPFPGIPGFETRAPGAWRGGFNSFHLTLQQGDVVVIRDWKKGSGDSIARWEFHEEKDFGPVSFVENSTLDLFHKAH